MYDGLLRFCYSCFVLCNNVAILVYCSFVYSTVLIDIYLYVDQDPTGSLLLVGNIHLPDYVVRGLQGNRSEREIKGPMFVSVSVHLSGFLVF